MQYGIESQSAAWSRSALYAQPVKRSVKPADCAAALDDADAEGGPRVRAMLP